MKHINFRLKRTVTALLFISVATVGCQSQQSTFPSGHYTIVEERNLSPNTYMLIDKGGYVLYKKCTNPNSEIQERILDEGRINRKGNSFTYHSMGGGPAGKLTKNGDSYKWRNFDGSEYGVMNPGWTKEYAPC